MAVEPAGGGRAGSPSIHIVPGRRDAGFSLIETIVALALTVVVLAGLYGAVRPALLLNRSLPAMADAQPKFTQLTGYFADFGRISGFTYL